MCHCIDTREGSFILVLVQLMRYSFSLLSPTTRFMTVLQVILKIDIFRLAQRVQKDIVLIFLGVEVELVTMTIFMHFRMLCCP